MCGSRVGGLAKMAVTKVPPFTGVWPAGFLPVRLIRALSELAWFGALPAVAAGEPEAAVALLLAPPGLLALRLLLLELQANAQAPSTPVPAKAAPRRKVRRPYRRCPERVQ